MRSLAYFGFLQRIKINGPAQRILHEIRQRTGGRNTFYYAMLSIRCKHSTT
jgi:hypothetical protein